MSDAEIIEEAVRLMDSGDYRAALPLWEQLRSGAHDETSIGVYLLNECRCVSAIGDSRRAELCLDELRRIDQQGQFRFYIELIDIDQLHGRGEYDKANARAMMLLERHATDLADPRFVDVVCQLKYSLARGLVNAGKYEVGLEALSRLLPSAEERDIRTIRYYRSLALHNLEKDGQAIEELFGVIDPKIEDQVTADAHYDLGMILKSQGAYTEAKNHLREAERLQHLLTVPVRDVYSALAWVYMDVNELEECKRYTKLANSVPRATQ